MISHEVSLRSMSYQYYSTRVTLTTAQENISLFIPTRPRAIIRLISTLAETSEPHST
jgi:hypothetical protein